MITSKDNPQLKELKKLQEKRFRSRRGQFAAEGEDLVEAALVAGWKPERLFCAPDAPPELLAHPSAWAVEYDLLAGACALGSGARVVGVFELPSENEADLGQLALYAHSVGDPGNVGTLIRSAGAFADSPVLLSEGSADPYSPKALRAGMGATFASPPQTDAVLADLPGTKVALDASGTVDVADVTADGPVILVVGSERDGLDQSVLDACDTVARIPMRGDGPESLNVAMAATIALYELSKGINRETTK